MPDALATGLPPALRTLLSDLDEAGVSWCLLRPLPLLDDVRSGDIDLLVAPGQLPLVAAAGREVGFVTVPGRSHGLHRLLFDPALAGWLWIHLVDELCFGPRYRLCTNAEAACLARTSITDGLRRLHPEDEFWTTLLHCLLDKGAIAPRHRARLGLLARTAGTEGPLALVVARVCPEPWTPERIVDAVTRNAWSELERLPAAVLARWPKRAPVRPGPGPVRRIRGAIQFRLRGWRRRGISVALIGPDGAGKTTIAREIGNGFVFPVRQVYMGLTGGLLRYVDRVRVPGLVLLGRLTVVWGRYLYARSLQARGALVVFDRYVYDAVAPTPYPLSRAARISRWIAGHACPSPDLVLVLSAPGEVMFRRKGAYTPEQLESWRQHFLSLERRLPNLEVVDTTRPLDIVRNDVIGRIWRRYQLRWR